MGMDERQSWAQRTAFVVIDLLALILSFCVSYLVKFGNLRFSENSYWTALLMTACLINLIINLQTNPYRDMFRRPYFEELYRGFVRMLLNLAIASFLLYLMKLGEKYSRSVIFFTYIIYYCVSTVLKYGWKRLVLFLGLEAFAPERVSLLIVCYGKDAKKTIRNALAGDVVIYDIKAVCLLDGSGGRKTAWGIPVLPDGVDFTDFALVNNVQEVLISAPPEGIDSNSYRWLLANGVRVHLNVESIVGFEPEDQRVTQVGVFKALSLDNYSFSSSQLTYLGFKRLLDIVFSLAGCVLLIPISFLVKLVNLFSGDTAPIFYTQTRIGRYGKEFKMYKFRTMVPNADRILKKMLQQEKYRLEWEENQKFEHDPRITKAGRILRRSSVDELPQLFNVLLGDMSLIGPRPLVKGELESHDGLKLYCKIKPGITGWWGCNGRSNIDYRERLDLEYYYIKNISLHLDILCVLRTVFSVLKREGAK